MVKQTTLLFIKALIIGVALNFGIRYATNLAPMQSHMPPPGRPAQHFVTTDNFDK